ncbi:aminotransferase class I/II-fold pyridoxal phosphate-dependent enzyme [Yanshouia hominis]|uniref:Methionine gamma-lyase family protein n=1 Tax=Yanshouia hominis TaxID=2763673 RepID=A0ABR7NI79_9FIRM|nr:methionine gamma-lyase family protein [Yanshouia hominis]MBC8576106.1 methionine gamma-lyase family protein [Yanshouia hominis]
MIETPFPILPEILAFAGRAEAKAQAAFSAIDTLEQYNGMKVLKAFLDHGVSTAHLSGSTGYGYGDIGRETLDAVFASAFGAEDALVRHSFVSGTHALTVGLFGLLRPGDTLLSLTGSPYDTLEEVIGIRDSGRNDGSLSDWGVRYRQIGLKSGKIDLVEAADAAKSAAVAYIQRSRGYSLRPSLSVEEIAEAVRVVKASNPGILVMVDNCYGEFTERAEPTEAGADLIAGSLIKNPGGGVARTGGYLAGRHDLIERCSYRLTTPGSGREVGCSLDELRAMYLGLFLAPTTVASALKTAVFAAALFEEMGFETYPTSAQARHDIIQAIALRTPEALIAFCGGIQSGSPIDSTAAPEPWDMPGYESQVIMAAGTFTLGASIELSADGPMREPYAVWLQGGLTYPTGKAGVLLAADRLWRKNHPQG